MGKQSFINYVVKVGRDHPELRNEIQDTFELALSEIEEGGSESHEWELAEGHISELVEDLQ